MFNVLKRNLISGKQTFGLWITIPHGDVSECLSRVPFDWFVFDQEHSPLDDQLSQQLIQAMGATEVTPLIRVAANDPVLIKKALDTGAHGVVIPYVNTREDAERAVSACLYPPRGMRGCGLRRGKIIDPDYLLTANDEMFVMVQVETVEAVENVEAILSVEGVDAYFVGPYDLSASMGILGELSNPQLQEAIASVFAVGQRLGRPGGLWMGAGLSLEERVREGWQFLSLGMDIDLLMTAGKTALATARAAGKRGEGEHGLK
jgi:2-keto-3-deoxy-L-rhamnonate aldolase RhmA